MKNRDGLDMVHLLVTPAGRRVGVVISTAAGIQVDSPRIVSRLVASNSTTTIH